MPSVRASSLIIASLLLAACGGGGDDTGPPGPFDREVAAADVSILYPLTAATAVDDLIAAGARGAYGELVPTTLAGSTPALDLAGQIGATYAELRLVALRLDPCSARATCSPEVRAIFQPVAVRDGQTAAADAALHVFYAVPDAELLRLLEEILALKKAHGDAVDYGETLSIQPILAATGLRGPFALGLERALLAHLGASRIERVTAMAHLFFDNDAWSFASFDRLGDRFAPATIVDTAETMQLINGTSADDAEIGGLFDSTPTPSLPQLGALAMSSRPDQSTAAMATGFVQAIAAQDPARHTSEDTDCVSCHVAEGARRAGIEHYGFEPSGDVTSARSLAYRRDGKALTNLHAFSYLGTQVSIMRRVSNESAVVADWFEAALADE